jgi:hypothetical protein
MALYSGLKMLLRKTPKISKIARLIWHIRITFVAHGQRLRITKDPVVGNVIGKEVSIHSRLVLFFIFLAALSQPIQHERNVALQSNIGLRSPFLRFLS